MNAVSVLKWFQEFIAVLGTISIIMYSYWSLYTLVGLFTTKKFPAAKKFHKYAIMIAARNESAVIGNLIDSINSQDYPSELLTVFVVADNCTDNTAEIARSHGAICYERQDPDHRTKGYALEFLVDNIKKDYGIYAFDAYFIFDADNLLKKDYMTRMNEAFDSGEKIVTSYRNTKNFDDNWIAASYGIHWLRTVRCEHRPRSVFNLATRIQGTGFMFESKIIEDGWHYVSFTEDRAFAADAVVNGYRISYCDAAEFYDEQPTSLRIAFRQRIRWGKGHLQAFAESGPMLFKHIFFWKNMPVDNDVRECENKASMPFITGNTGSGTNGTESEVLSSVNASVDGIRKTGFFKRIAGSRFMRKLKMRFMSFDMFLIVFPSNVFWLFSRWLKFFSSILICIISTAVLSRYMDAGAALMTSIFGGYYKKMILGIYVFFIERKRIIKINFWKKVYYTIMWPIFDIIGSISVMIAMFSHVEWKPIPHNSDVNIETISSELASKK